MLEAVAVVGTAALTAVTGMQWQPFCERCQVWCSATEKLLLTPVSNLPQTKLQIAQRDFSFLQKTWSREEELCASERGLT